MDRRNALEENFGFRRVNEAIDPSRPCCHPFIVRHEPIHVFIHFPSFAYVIPSAFQSKMHVLHHGLPDIHTDTDNVLYRI